jgi:fructose-1,6-bisphosphatase/sedoheptulose 1,7-bisphosphatase-like protein
MLYQFKSKAGADVLMLADSATAVLRLMGRDPAPQGILEAASLHAYVAQLEAGVAADEAEFQRAVDEAKAAGQPAPRRQGVSLRQRAWPLRDLMQRSARAGADVVWGV